MNPLDVSNNTKDSVLMALVGNGNTQTVNGRQLKQVMSQDANDELCRVLGLTTDDNWHEFKVFILWFNWVNQCWYVCRK